MKSIKNRSLPGLPFLCMFVFLWLFCIYLYYYPLLMTK